MRWKSIELLAGGTGVKAASLRCSTNTQIHDTTKRITMCDDTQLHVHYCANATHHVKLRMQGILRRCSRNQCRSGNSDGLHL